MKIAAVLRINKKVDQVASNMILLLVCFALSQLCLVASHSKPESKSSAKNSAPNFVVFFVDDLGYGDVGFNGHPTTKTPNLDKLAFNGKILTTWYSGCNVCTGSRAALMTGRQWTRTGLPGVIGPAASYGLNLEEITLAEQLKKGGYATGIVGKWHLGQRKVHLPGSRGFDYYLGIPFSDDMGIAWESQCPTNENYEPVGGNDATSLLEHKSEQYDSWSTRELYEQSGMLNANTGDEGKPEPKPDKGAKWLPLVYQEHNKTQILEQPLDFTTLAQKYSEFATTFIEKHQESPFFLYVPFSHVHVTAWGSTNENQYAGCDFQNSTERGTFGDALAETDWIAGTIIDKLKELGLEENTLILFTSDNGPWMSMKLSGGSAGLFTGRFAEGYTNTAKGTNWEGGIREPAFAYWKGKIKPFSRSSEVISSLDVFPTLSALAGIPLPDDRLYDGKDMSQILLTEDGKSNHDFLFFYGDCMGTEYYYNITSVRHGKYKAHWCTAPGLQPNRTELIKKYDPPLLFDVEKDPSESEPISFNAMPSKPEDLEAMKRILSAYAMEKSTFQYGNITQEPDGPGEGPGHYALCCDRSKDCNCESNVGIFNLGTKRHHDEYHEALGVEEPLPPRTRYQSMLRNVD